MYGWTGKLLRVDLTNGQTKVESVNEQWARDYIGGRGLGAKYYSEEVDPNVDPLSPDNNLLFVTGPLTGTNASCGARYMVVTKGALNGTITTSNSGGYWGPELKYAGYDMIILEGKSSKPVYLWIYNDEVEICDAKDVWGKSVWDSEDLIKEEIGCPDASIASIGPAGEKHVLFAAIMNDKHRAAGRNGVGAVMGSKNLKAIAVRGTGAVALASPAAFMKAQWKKKKKLKEAPVTGQGLPTYGTAVLVNAINEHGAMPTKNFQFARMEPSETNTSAEPISGETLHATRLAGTKACFACTIACGRINTIPSKEADTKFSVTTSPRNWRIATEGPEYENTWSLGADCNIDDLDAIIKANYICNELGMDPISLGATIAAAMELYEKGAISKSDTKKPLEFGSGDALVYFTEQTAMRSGFGNELAEGGKRLCEKYGHPELFMGTKGMEFPAYDPRAIQGMGLGYATSNRGGCHLKAYTVSAEVFGIPEKMDPASIEGKAALTIAFQNLTSAWDASGLCIFLSFGVGGDDILAELVTATGVEYTLDELLKVGERIYNLERQWLLHAGFSGADDNLPKRLTDTPIPVGPTKGQVSRLSEMLPEYYRLRGWTPDGVPTSGKLAELDLPTN